MIRLNPLFNQSFPPVVVPSEGAFEHASRMVNQLAQNVIAHRKTADAFDEVETLIASLPLQSAEFSVASCRLRNARVSTERGELGAAKYELRLLSRSLFTPSQQ